MIVNAVYCFTFPLSGNRVICIKTRLKNSYCTVRPFLQLLLRHAGQVRSYNVVLVVVPTQMQGSVSAAA